MNSKLMTLATEKAFAFLAFALTLLLLSAGAGFAQSVGGSANGLNLQDLANQFRQSDGTPQPGGSLAPEARQTVLGPKVPYAFPLPPSELEKYYSRRSSASLKQFGYDSLGNPAAVPFRQMGGLQDSYILGPGDAVNVSLVGQENRNFNERVGTDGNLQLPGLAPISAAGRRLGDVRTDIEGKVKGAYVATQVYVSVGAVRQIGVLVSGEVQVPGPVALNALNSVVDALLLAGGVKKTGSLRHIEILRGDETVPVDLYTVLTSADGAPNYSLTDGDKIIVPPIGATVAITGDVTRPGIFEVAPDHSSMSAEALLKLAGGYSLGGTPRLSLLKVAPSGAQTFEPVRSRQTGLRKGDILFVSPPITSEHGRVVLEGQVRAPGVYDLTRVPNLRALLGSPNVYEEQPFMVFAAISRRDPVTLTRKIIPFAPSQVLQGTFDMPLQDDDIVRIFSVPEMRVLAAQLAVEDERHNLAAQDVRKIGPGSSDANQGASGSTGAAGGQPNFAAGTVGAALAGQGLSSQIVQSGAAQNTAQGLAEEAQARRQQYSASSGPTAPPGGGTPVTTVTGQVPSDGNRISYPAGDEPCPVRPIVSDTQAQASASAGQYPYNPYSASPYAGAQNFPVYPSTSSGQMSQQSMANGGYNGLPPVPQFDTSSGYNPKLRPFGRWNLVLDLCDPVVRNQLANYGVSLLGAVQVTGEYLVAPGVGLDSLVAAAGGLTISADLTSVEVTSTTFDSNSGRADTTRTSFNVTRDQLDKITLRARDVVRFRDVFSDRSGGQVVIRGQLRFPGVFDLLRGERLSSVLARAGGLTDVAYPYGAVFTRESAARAEEDGYRRGAEELEREFTVLVSGDSGVTPQGVQFIRDTIQRLHTARGVGRISVDADPASLAAHPDRDMILEPGDFLFIPRRPNSVSVTGEVLSAGSYLYKSGASASHYIQLAGGYALGADRPRTFVLMPDGTARPLSGSLLRFRSPDIVPGATIIVPRNLTPFRFGRFAISVSQIFSQLAVSAASIAVISK